MGLVDLIKKKRDGFALSKDDIYTIINGFVSGQIPDYQVAALLMAIYFREMNDEETAYLTDAMMRSGDLIDLSTIPGIKIDKHSTGGVGDKTTLVLGPLVASAGVPVAKMSGRGLGHTGGTLDKLESIPGFDVSMSADHFCRQVKKHGIAICSQNAQLVPADKKLYALRDVTGTVDNISLIASSVMSKKLACGADGIVIDLKIGDGAFIKNLTDAEKLARIMISTAHKMNRKLVAVITGMEEPLGYAIGNALEVKEATDTLKGKGPKGLTEL
ncbi:MAG: thymidine phosphorylase [Saprospiraceae bacterium]|nr:thymidine phosphorylase [Saprospiraceae bacterium]